jgi:DNA-binding response OmpR family regulator
MSSALRILVVDDEPTIVDSAGQYLRARGFVVTTARELEEAEALLVFDEFDVVVTDVRLTAGSREEGLELTSFVKGRSPRTAVIVMSGFVSEETRHTALENGACLVLDKPVPLSVIEQSVVSISSKCALAGTFRGVLCEPLRIAAGRSAAASTEVTRLSELLSELSPERGDDDNAATIEAMLRVVDRLDASPNRRLGEMVGFCLSGSTVLAAVAGATSGQPHARRLANRLQERLQALKSQQ